MIKLKANAAKAEITETERITSGRVGLLVELDLSADFDGLTKIVVCRGGDVSRDIPVIADQPLIVPHECLAAVGANLVIGVYGENESGNVVLPTVYANAGRIYAGADPSGQEDPPPTPSEVQQILTAANNAVATANSVRQDADEGVFDGQDGADGADGEDGVGITSIVFKSTDQQGGNIYKITMTDGSTYEITAPKGAQGVQGADGEPGSDGFSPSASVVKVGSVSTFTVTDKSGTTEVKIEDGLLPQVTITTVSNATVTVKKGIYEKIYSVGSDGTITVSVPEFGHWEITAVKDSESNAKTLTVDSVKQYKIIIPIGSVYGVEWNRTSSPIWARTDAATLFTDPVPYMAGLASGEYGSPFDEILPWSGMIRVYDPQAGELVAIPKFYYKWTNDSEKMKLQISAEQKTGFFCSPAHVDRGDGKGERDVVYVGRYHCSEKDYKSNSGAKPKVSITRATARTAIHNLGQNIWQLDHAMWWTINMLYLVEYANANCQGTIGYGRGNGSSAEIVGYTDTMPYHTGTIFASKTQYGVSTQYRNIEGLWDNVVDWCDGIYFSGANIYHILNPARFSDAANGTLTGTRATETEKVVKGFTFPNIEGYEWAGYPGSADIGSTTTTGENYFCDNEYYSATGVVLSVGGSYSQTQVGGLFYRNGDNAASHASASVGARLQKLP